MDAGRLNVLHDAHDVDFVAVADRVDFSLLSPVEEMINEYDHFRVFLEDAKYVAFQFGVVDHDAHILATEYVAGAYEDGVTDALGNVQGLICILSRTELRACLLSSFAASLSQHTLSLFHLTLIMSVYVLVCDRL